MVTRVRARVEGQVQGVGFRPAVYRHAVACGLTGFVRNDPQGVTLDVEGEESAVDGFFAALEVNSPCQSHIEKITIRRLPPRGYGCFEVEASSGAGEARVHLPPDLATCDMCLQEMRDPEDRRFRYPFINCVDCGPRFTIVRGLPYDRVNTSMDEFLLCPECAAEYHDPRDRRFHAQPNACPECGPRLFLLGPEGSRLADGDEALVQAQQLIVGGGVVAVKGLGGYHLACDALSEDAVGRLRRHKDRRHKSLAVMFKDLETLRARLSLTSAETAEVLSVSRPIVVVRGRLNSAVSPDTDSTGAFLPYAPIHHLLLEPFEALVLTSGNRRDEPLAHDEPEALALLDGFADAILAHDRPVMHRCDDSVVQVVDGRRSFLRRARGFVPSPVRLAPDSEAVLATGGEMKTTFCLVVRGEAYVSQHIGELRDYPTHAHYRGEIDRWETLLRVHPRVIAHDLHPSYLSTRYAQGRQGARLVGVQHHHAHVASVMAECDLHAPVIGVALDGTGYGPDGTVWGGEILLADRLGFERLAHFKTYALPGGERAIEEPWRMALSVARAEGLPWRPGAGAGAKAAGPYLDATVAAVEELLAASVSSSVNCPLTSSAGRLFDAAAALLDVCMIAEYEAQGAIRLEACADQTVEDHYPYLLHRPAMPWVLDFGPALRQLLEEKSAGMELGVIAARFHNAVAAAVVEACVESAPLHGIGDVAAFRRGVPEQALARRRHPAAAGGRAKGVLQLRGPCERWWPLPGSGDSGRRPAGTGGIVMCLAVPAEVIALEGRVATVSAEGALRQVDVSLVEDVALGDYVLVHAGFALHRWDLEDYREWQEIQRQMLEAEAGWVVADSAAERRAEADGP